MSDWNRRVSAPATLLVWLALLLWAAILVAVLALVF